MASTTTMAKKTGISLKSLYIFNSTLSSKEGDEEKKILFYHPPADSIDLKIREVGLSEAIIKFTETFTGENDGCKVVQTMKCNQVFYQPEPNFWMVLTINAPYDKKPRDGVEYKGDDVHDKIYEAVLVLSYKVFRLLNGTFGDNFVGETVDDKSLALICKFEHFFSGYVASLNLADSDMLTVFKSIQYLPLKQKLYLQIHNLTTTIESTLPSVKHCLFLYKEEVIWSGINPDDLFSIYQYLTGTLLPTINEEMFPVSMNNHTSSSSFLMGPASCERQPIRTFIYNDDGQQELYLVIYQALNVTCCLFTDKNIPDDFYSDLQMMSSKIAALSSEIDNYIAENKASVDSKRDDLIGPRFIYLNSCNSRHKGNLSTQSISTDLKNIMMDLFEKDARNISEETIVKTMNDYWILQKNSNLRTFFVLINKYATLLDITEEASKMYDQHIQDMFFEK